jgi:HK97 family phage major capsid protein
MTIAAQIGRLNSQIETNQKAKDFATLAKIIALSKGDHWVPQQLLEKLDPRTRILAGQQLKAIIGGGSDKIYTLSPRDIEQTKAAVLAGGTASGDWSEQLANYQILASAFLESLRNFGAFDKLLPSMKRVPFRTRIGTNTSAVTGATVGQQSVKPISKLSLTATQIDEAKVAAIMVVTEELARASDSTAGNLFATELSNAIAVATDSFFVTELTSGATSFASNGATAEHTRVDLRGLLAAITTGARSQLFLLTTSTIAKALSVLHTNTGAVAFEDVRYNGGSIGGVELIVSDGVPSGTMLLVDATQIAAASETIRLDSSREALLNMDTSPDSPAAGTVMQSLWQYNMVGLLAERFVGIEKLTSKGVAVVTSVSYSGDSPGP